MLQVSKLDATGPALAQAAARTAHANSYEQALHMEAQFEKLAVEAVRAGETPSMDSAIREAVNTALTTLEEELKTEKIANDDTFKAANGAVAQCNANMDKAFSRPLGVNGMKKVAFRAQSSHSSCRGIEDEERRDEKTNCDSRDTYAQSSHDAAPKCTCEGWKGAAVEKQCLEAALNWGEKYNTELGNKITKCAASVAKAAATAQKCDADQSSFEMAFCAYDIELTGACSAKTDCYKLQMINRDRIQKELKVKEASEKIMWKSVKKVGCYLDMLDASTVTEDEYAKCKSLDSSTTHLDLLFPPAVDEAVCELVPAKPGEEAWATGELSGYASLPTAQNWLQGFEGLKSVTSCVKAQPAASDLIAEKSRAIVKPLPTYYRKAQGSGCCKEGEQIQSFEDCQVAIDALGLKSPSKWKGKHTRIPGQCSWRGPGGHNGSGGENLHWNSVGGCGGKRRDLTPICKHG
jgi:hypothetical protein